MRFFALLLLLPFSLALIDSILHIDFTFNIQWNCTVRVPMYAHDFWKIESFIFEDDILAQDYSSVYYDGCTKRMCGQSIKYSDDNTFEAEYFDFVLVANHTCTKDGSWKRDIIRNADGQFQQFLHEHLITNTGRHNSETTRSINVTVQLREQPYSYAVVDFS